MSFPRNFGERLGFGISFLALCSLAQVAGAESIDAQALKHLSAANAATAQSLSLATCASERSAIAGAAKDCAGNPTCVLGIAAIAALTPCAASNTTLGSAVVATPVPQLVQMQPAREPTLGEKVLSGLGWGFAKLFDTALAAAPTVANYRLGIAQSNNSTALGIVQSNNALAGTQSTNGTFASLGTNLQNTSVAGFGAIRDLGLKPTVPSTQVNAGAGSSITLGNGNNTQTGNENRQGSPGPCVNTPTVTAPATGGNGVGTTATPPATVTPGNGAPATNNAVVTALQPCGNPAQ